LDIENVVSCLLLHLINSVYEVVEVSKWIRGLYS